MRTLRIAAAAAVLVGSMLLLPDATEAQNAAHGIPGYLNPVTGSFTARANLPQSATPKQVGGTITVTTTVSLDSTIPAGLPIFCSVSITTFDDVANNTAGGSNLVTRVGNKATCVTTITFLWEIDASVTTKMFLTVNVSVGNFGTDQSRSASLSSLMIPLSTKKKSVTLAM
jgi:hypothetical protein